MLRVQGVLIINRLKTQAVKQVATCNRKTTVRRYWYAVRYAAKPAIRRILQSGYSANYVLPIRALFWKSSYIRPYIQKINGELIDLLLWKK
jgi:hypothetical protein